MFLSLFGNPPKFTATNAQTYGNPIKLTLSAPQNVEITNYKDKKNETNNIKISIFDDSVSIEKNGKKQGTADFSNDTFKLLRDIAKMDGNNEDITFEDLQKAKKNVAELKNVKNIKIDPEKGIVNIYDKNNKVRLHFDFETKQEKAQRTGKNEKAPTKTVNKPVKSKSIGSTKKLDNVETPRKKAMQMLYNYNFKIDMPDLNTVSNNTKLKDVKDLESVAKYTGIPKEYIKEVLVNMEGSNKFPVLKAEYDGVKDKDHPKGHLTIGFGHTALIGKPQKFKLGDTISEAQAYQILANDLVTSMKNIKYTLKLNDINFRSIPKNIQHALIDLSFNKGPNVISNVKGAFANLKQKNYAVAYADICWYETPSAGLRKRNIVRFLAGLNGFSKKEQRIAMKRFDETKDRLYETYKSLACYPKEQQMVLKMWDDAAKNCGYKNRHKYLMKK